MSIPKALGKKLRLLRKARQESLMTAAKGIGGVSYQHLARIESGHSDFTFILACRVSKYYGISMEEMAKEALQYVVLEADQLQRP